MNRKPLRLSVFARAAETGELVGTCSGDSGCGVVCGQKDQISAGRPDGIFRGSPAHRGSAKPVSGTVPVASSPVPGPGRSSACRTRSRSCSTARALVTAAVILGRERMIAASCIRAWIRSSSKAATASGSKPSKAWRKASRRESTVAQDSPAWKPSRHSRS